MIPDSMFLVFNTVRMYREMLRGTGAAVKPRLSVSHFLRGVRKTWQKRKNVKFLVTA